MTDDEQETYRCRAGVDGYRCDFRGTRPELRAHADEVGHPRCIVGAEVLHQFERQTCDQCAQRVRNDLDAIVADCVDLARRVREGAYSGGWLGALSMLADGSVDGLRPWVDPAGAEHREHFEDHWRGDPPSVLAVLESNERDWRREFGHGPADDLATVKRCAAYLRAWLPIAAHTHPAFDEFAGELGTLRVLVENVAALALHPKASPIRCECGGQLEQRFAERTGHQLGGLSDNRTCRACGHVYKPAEFMFRYRLLTEMPGWVSVARAAEATERSEDTIWAWVRALDVPSACHRLSRRTVVELAAAAQKSDQTARQVRRRSA